MELGIVIIGYAVAAALAFGLRRRRACIAVAAAVWLSLPFYNAWILAGCSGDCSIRVDLVPIAPLVVLATIPALAYARGKRAQRP